MSKYVIFFGWNRTIPGCEQAGAEHFQDFMQYLGQLQQEGAIDSFEPVLLRAHGGDMNGFVLIRGESVKLDDLHKSEGWIGHMIRAGLHSEGVGEVRGVSGEGVMELMSVWSQAIAS